MPTIGMSKGAGEGTGLAAEAAGNEICETLAGLATVEAEGFEKQSKLAPRS